MVHVGPPSPNSVRRSPSSLTLISANLAPPPPSVPVCPPSPTSVRSHLGGMCKKALHEWLLHYHIIIIIFVVIGIISITIINVFFTFFFLRADSNTE